MELNDGIMNLKRKAEFVERINYALTAECSDSKSIEKVEYAVFQDAEHETWITEFAVVHYKGGAVQARYCNGSSCSAIYEEIGNMLYTSQRFGQDTDHFKKYNNGEFAANKRII